MVPPRSPLHQLSELEAGEFKVLIPGVVVLVTGTHQWSLQCVACSLVPPRSNSRWRSGMWPMSRTCPDCINEIDAKKFKTHQNRQCPICFVERGIFGRLHPLFRIKNNYYKYYITPTEKKNETNSS